MNDWQCVVDSYGFVVADDTLILSHRALGGDWQVLLRAPVDELRVEVDQIAPALRSGLRGVRRTPRAGILVAAGDTSQLCNVKGSVIDTREKLLPLFNATSAS